MNDFVSLVPSGHSKPIGRYSAGVCCAIEPGDTLIHISGQVSTDQDGRLLCPGDPGGQAKVVFQRLKDTLAAADANLEDLISVTVFISDPDHFSAVSKVRDKVFSKHAPASTLVVAKMIESGCLLEINGVAVKRGNLI